MEFILRVIDALLFVVTDVIVPAFNVARVVGVILNSARSEVEVFSFNEFTGSGIINVHVGYERDFSLIDFEIFDTIREADIENRHVPLV